MVTDGPDGQSDVPFGIISKTNEYVESAFKTRITCHSKSKETQIFLYKVQKRLLKTYIYDTGT